MENLLRSFRILVCLLAFLEILAPLAGAQAQLDLPQVPGQISSKDATALEEGLKTAPDNLEAREKLIAYYFETNIQSQSPDIEGIREKHIFWLIENHPESDVAGSPDAQILPLGMSSSTEGYQHGKELWLLQTNKYPDSQRILRHAAAFLSNLDGKAARGLLEKAWALNPKDADTSLALAQSYEFERDVSTSSEQKSELAKKILSLREQSLEGTADAERFYMLGDVGVAAFDAGEVEKAKQYATELLTSAQRFRNDWNYGNALHHANILLGRIALSRGDVVGAKQYLLAAGQMPGSPQLDSFGPNMTWAKELLEKGETESVLSYLESCAKFWKMGGSELNTWIAIIKGGGIPDFGANLSY